MDAQAEACATATGALSPFGRWLEAQADEVGLSLGEAAALAGLSERTLELSLLGRQPRAETCRRLAVALGVDASQVLRAAGHPVPGEAGSGLPAELEEIAEKIRAADPGSQQALVRAWRGLLEMMAAQAGYGDGSPAASSDPGSSGPTISR